jgi:hypothetical protein
MSNEYRVSSFEYGVLSIVYRMSRIEFEFGESTLKSEF